MPKRTPEGTEVVPLPGNDRRQRRRFSAEEKDRIVEEANRCQRGELAVLLHREGLYSSQLANWRAQLKPEGLEGLREREPGPKAGQGRQGPRDRQAAEAEYQRVKGRVNVLRETAPGVALVQKIRGLIARNEYKRRQAPSIIRVRARSFGVGRQMPIAAKV